MPKKPSENLAPTIYIYWTSNEGLMCPLCSSKLQHEFNNGGRKVITLKGPLWVITNYYSCTNPACDLSGAFPAAYHSAMKRKRFSLDIWAKVIQHHFKHHFNYSVTVELMWDDWDVSISRGAVRSICEFFEMAGKQYINKKSLKKLNRTIESFYHSMVPSRLKGNLLFGFFPIDSREMCCSPVIWNRLLLQFYATSFRN